MGFLALNNEENMPHYCLNTVYDEHFCKTMVPMATVALILVIHKTTYYEHIGFDYD